MGAFFSQLVGADLLESWASTLDWLFNDDRFSSIKGWDKAKVCRFTKQVKKLAGFTKESFLCCRLDTIAFPNAENPPRIANIPTILMGTGEAEGRALVRHIRNGIAHGNSRCFKIKKELYIEIIDYGKAESAKITKTNQTAYICIPLNYIPQIYNIYSAIERAEDYNRSRGKTKRDKKSA